MSKAWQAKTISPESNKETDLGIFKDRNDAFGACIESKEYTDILIWEQNSDGSEWFGYFLILDKDYLWCVNQDCDFFCVKKVEVK